MDTNLDVLNQKEIEMFIWLISDNTCTHPKVLSSAFKIQKRIFLSR